MKSMLFIRTCVRWLFGVWQKEYCGNALHKNDSAKGYKREKITHNVQFAIYASKIQWMHSHVATCQQQQIATAKFSLTTQCRPTACCRLPKKYARNSNKWHLTRAVYKAMTTPSTGRDLVSPIWRRCRGERNAPMMRSRNKDDGLSFLTNRSNPVDTTVPSFNDRNSFYCFVTPPLPSDEWPWGLWNNKSIFACTSSSSSFSLSMRRAGLSSCDFIPRSICLSYCRKTLIMFAYQASCKR